MSVWLQGVRRYVNTLSIKAIRGGTAVIVLCILGVKSIISYTVYYILLHNELIGSLSFSVKEILSQTLKIAGWYHLLTNGEGRLKSIAVEDKPGAGHQYENAADGTANSTLGLSNSWLPTKMVVLHWSPSGYGFLLQPGSPVTISHVEEGLPAQLAGIQEGDVLLQVEENSVIGADYQEVMDLIGSYLSTLRLLVQRPQSESAEETTKLLSSERPISGDSIFDTKSSLVGSGILKKRRALGNVSSIRLSVWSLQICWKN